jgi:ATP-dependent helicase HrpB
LRFIDPPPGPAIEEARMLLAALGALDQRGALTKRGEQMRALALPPRLAAMVVAGRMQGRGRAAAELAVLLTEQGLGGPDVDLEVRDGRGFAHDRSPEGLRPRVLLRRGSPEAPTPLTRPTLADGRWRCWCDAFPGPHRPAKRRHGSSFVLANGRGAVIDETRQAGRIGLSGDRRHERQGTGGANSGCFAELSGEAWTDVLATRAVESEECVFDSPSGSVRARRISRLGAITLAETPLPKPDDAAAMAVLCQAIRKLGLKALPFSSAGLQLRDRIGFLHRSLGAPWPDVSDEALLEALETWFAPYQPGILSFKSIDRDGLNEGLLSLCGPGAQKGTRPAGADPLPGADRFAAAHPL